MPDYREIPLETVTVGMEIDLHWPGHGGVGGRVTALEPFTIVGGTAQVVRVYTAEQLTGVQVSVEVALPASDCIQYGDDCHGPVDYRTALSGTGVNHPRCEKHWHVRLDTEERLRRDYPDTDTPPSWFDPTYAGERWNDDY